MLIFWYRSCLRYLYSHIVSVRKDVFISFSDGLFVHLDLRNVISSIDAMTPYDL